MLCMNGKNECTVGSVTFEIVRVSAVFQLYAFLHMFSRGLFVAQKYS